MYTFYNYLYSSLCFGKICWFLKTDYVKARPKSKKNIEAILTLRVSRKAVDSSSILMASTWLQWRKLVDVIAEIFSVQYVELGKVQKE